MLRGKFKTITLTLYLN